VFSLKALKRTRKLIKDLEHVPFVKKVRGLTNVEFMEGTRADDLIIYDLMADFPATQEEADRIRKKLMAKPIYVDSFISKDGTCARDLCEVKGQPRKMIPNLSRKDRAGELKGRGLEQNLRTGDFPVPPGGDRASFQSSMN